MRPDLPCTFCAANELSNCVKQPPPTHRNSNPANNYATTSYTNAGSTEKLSDIAMRYEASNPTASLDEMLRLVTSYVQSLGGQQYGQQYAQQTYAKTDYTAYQNVQAYPEYY
jgi:hypothetical protein